MGEIEFVLGVALVLVNAQSNNQLKDIWDLVSNPSTAATNIPNVRSNMYLLGGELIFVAVLSFLAGASRAWGGIVITLTIALWIVWSMNHVPQMNALFKAMQGDVPGSTRSTQG